MFILDVAATGGIMARNDRDHGGGLDRAIAQYGGDRAGWVDLSTGINPRAFALADLPNDAWTALPDQCADDHLCAAARAFWNVPDGAAILAVPGCSSAIAQIPYLAAPGAVRIPGPTYNEHAASFAAAGWQLNGTDPAQAQVIVHPNNPTGHFHDAAPDAALVVIDESFCDVAPAATMIARATQPGHLVLKSFGKFWGLAGLRLGFVVGDAALVQALKVRLGPWPVSGPALAIGTQALTDRAWADDTRDWLRGQMAALDDVMAPHGAHPMGDVPLFRTYRVDDAAQWQNRLARAHIWSRVFPYDPHWLRLGVPTQAALDRVKAAL